MLTGAFLHKLDALALPMRNRAIGAAGGARRSRGLGSSSEFSDFREYTPGDDIRRIDWNAYARFDKLFLKLFMEEQESVLTVIVDKSASMAGDKWNAAVRACESLIYLALRGGDRARVVALGGASAVSPLCAGRAGYARASQFLASLIPDGTLHLNDALARVAIGGRGQAFLVSDFLSDDGYDKGLASLVYRGQELMLAQVLAPEELAPELTGPVRLIDAESDLRLEVLAGAEALRAYEQALNALLSDLRSLAHRYGAPYVLLNAGDDFEDAVLGTLVRAGLIA